MKRKIILGVLILIAAFSWSYGKYWAASESPVSVTFNFNSETIITARYTSYFNWLRGRVSVDREPFDTADSLPNARNANQPEPIVDKPNL